VESIDERRGFGRRRGFSDRVPVFKPKPVGIGQEYEVEITEKSRRGEGIARIEGLVIFVPDTNPGDHARVKITRISRSFAEAKVVAKGETGRKEED
jgi:predicted RNA-binding protein with TRAM domain